jgi:hypothetical protein
MSFSTSLRRSKRKSSVLAEPDANEQKRFCTMIEQVEVVSFAYAKVNTPPESLEFSSLYSHNFIRKIQLQIKYNPFFNETCFVAVSLSPPIVTFILPNGLVAAILPNTLFLVPADSGRLCESRKD